MLSRFTHLGSDFRKYALAAVLASFAGGMQFIALSWFLYKATGTAWSLGLSMIISTLPAIVMGTWAGARVDRSNPRTVCAVADLVRGLALLVAAVAGSFPALTVPVLYGVVLVSAICDSFFHPAIGAMVRNLVPKDRLLDANVLANTSVQIGGLLGASIGGALVVWLGAAHAMQLNFVAFIASGLLIFAIDGKRHVPAPTAPPGRGGVLADYRGTFVYLREHPALLGLGALQILVYANFYVCNTALPVFVDRDLGASASAFGLIDSLWGFGAIAGGLTLSVVSRLMTGARISVVGLACMVAVITGLSVAINVPQAAIAYVAIGFLNCVLRIGSDTMMIGSADPAHYGKIKSTVMMFIAWFGLLIYAAVGFWGDRVSMRWIYRADAALLAVGLLVALAIAMSVPRQRRDAAL
jgi:MFS family permease